MRKMKLGKHGGYGGQMLYGGQQSPYGGHFAQPVQMGHMMGTQYTTAPQVAPHYTEGVAYAQAPRMYSNGIDIPNETKETTENETEENPAGHPAPIVLDFPATAAPSGTTQTDLFASADKQSTHSFQDLFPSHEKPAQTSSQ